MHNVIAFLFLQSNLDNEEYNKSSDIFSLGLIILEMISPRKNYLSVVKLLEDARKQILPASYSRNIPKMVCFVT